MLVAGKRRIHQKKRKFEMGRPPSMTKLGQKRVRTIRARGGNQKVRLAFWSVLRWPSGGCPELHWWHTKS